MKLKKKVIFGMVAGFFAVATVFNMGIEHEKENIDIMLSSALAQFGGPGESDPFEDNWGDCLTCTAGVGDDWDTVMITCYYLQGANGTCSETPCQYGWC